MAGVRCIGRDECGQFQRPDTDFIRYSGSARFTNDRREFTLGFDDGIDLSLKAHTDHFDIHDVMRQGRVPDNLVFGLNDLNLSIQGKGDSFKQSVLGGALQITAGSGRAGWLVQARGKGRKRERRIRSGAA